MTIPATDFDSPWKEALEQYLPDCLALFLPQAYAEIDWTRGYAFLDKELQQVAPQAALGRRLADKLVQVWRRNGDEAWVLIHIEVQHQEEADFARRMFGYYYRLLDRYNRPVASVAILGDERAGWRPATFQTALWDCAVHFHFPVIKLLDYRARWAELEASRNPFATVVMAHLRAQETRGDAAARGQAKLMLIRRLYDLGYGREEIVGLFRFIDWLLRLPDEEEDRFWESLQHYQKERQMTYITSVERIGLRKGLLTGLELALEVKFGDEGRRVADEIRQIRDVAVLEAIAERLRTATSVDEVRAVYHSPEA